MLQVADLTVAYGNVLAVRDVGFDVPPGRVVGILGANGAGKSTVLASISGLVKPVAGSISYQGHDLLAMEPHHIPALGIAHVREGRGIFPSLSVADNLLLGGYLRRSRSQRARDLDFVQELFPWLDAFAQRRAGSLSGGEQQMLSIARALMLRPTLLILDEPSLGLAPKIVNDVFDKLAEIRRERQVSILLVEQNAAQALEIIDTAVILENGRVTFLGPREQLLKTSFVERSYLGGI